MALKKLIVYMLIGEKEFYDVCYSSFSSHS